MKLQISLLFLLIGTICAQERSISGATRRNRFSAGKSQAVNFNCPEDFGYYPHPSDCSQYYVCVFGGALLESCTGGLMYSTELQTCDWPRNVVCKSSSGPGVSTVKITDPRTRSTESNSIHSATESLSSSSIINRGLDNTITNRQPVKSSGLSKSIFDDSVKPRQGRLFGNQEDPQRIDGGFQAQETSSRTFNVVPASASPNAKLSFPPSLPASSNTNRFSSIRSTTFSPTTEKFGDILNSNDTDYYYYYDDILYDDYYEPTQKSTTAAPVVRSSNRSRGKKGPKKSGTVVESSAVNSRGRGTTRSSSNIHPSSFPLTSFNPTSSFSSTFQSSRSTTGNNGDSPIDTPIASKTRVDSQGSLRMSPSRPPTTTRHPLHSQNSDPESTDISFPNKSNITTNSSATTSHTSSLNSTTASIYNNSKVAKQSSFLPTPSTVSPQVLNDKDFVEEFLEINDEDNEISKVKRLAFSDSEIRDNRNEFGETEGPKVLFPFATITVSQLRNGYRSSNRDHVPFKPRLLTLAPLNVHSSSDTNVLHNNSSINRKMLNTANRLVHKQGLAGTVNDTSLKLISERGKLLVSRFPNRRTELFGNRRPTLSRRISTLMNERLQELSNGRDTGQNKETKTLHIVKKVSPVSHRFANEKNSNSQNINPVRVRVALSSTSPISVSERTVVPPVPTRIVLRAQPSSEKRVNISKNTPKLSPLKSFRTNPVLIESPTDKITSRRYEKVSVLSSQPDDQNIDTQALRRIRIHKPIKDDIINDFRTKSDNSNRDLQQLNYIHSKGKNSIINNTKISDILLSEKEDSNIIPKLKLNEENNPVEDLKAEHSIETKNFKSVTSSNNRPSDASSQKKSSSFSELIATFHSNNDNPSKILNTKSITSSASNTKKSSATITYSQLHSLKLTNSSDAPKKIPKLNLSQTASFNDNPAITPRSTTTTTSLKPTTISKSPENLDTNLMPSISSQETGLDRGSSRNKPKTPTGSSPTSGGSPQVVGRTPQRLVRPLKKPTPGSSRSSLNTDIWKYPPRRPNPLYPTPQVDLTAAPCDQNICKLPDCYCGGRNIPGNLAPQNVPQMVLLTFDDSVNDLNKKLYVDLFEKGRVNPNGCPISATFYISHEWTDYSQVQNLYSDGHEIASHSITHSFGEQFSTAKWAKEVAGQREIMSAYSGVRMEDIRGMRAPFLAVGGNNMFRMLYDQNFTYDSSMPVYENNPPSWPYTLDYKLFHDCMIPPCPTHSFPGVWQVPMVMWQDLTGGRCSMGDACTTPPDAEGVYKMLIKNFERHYTTNRSPFGLFYHAAWFTTPHHKEGFIAFLDTISAMDDVWLVTNWQALQWVRDPTPLSKAKSFPPFQCDYPERPPRCTTPKVCNVWHKGSVRYLKTCYTCPESYPWVGNTGVQSPLNDV